MSTIAAQLTRPCIRHFSAHRPRPDSRAARAVAMSCLVSGVVLPFVPPALESSREKNSGYPNHNKWASSSHTQILFPLLTSIMIGRILHSASTRVDL